MNSKKFNNNSEEFELFKYIGQINDRYLSPRDIQFRISSDPKEKQLLDIILNIRRQRSELAYPLLDQQQKPFRFWKTPKIEKLLYAIDTQKSRWQNNGSPSLLHELKTRGLIDEAFYSSWIEGARTTRRRAEDLARKGDAPQDRSERMVANNFRTLEFILKNLNHKLDEDFVCEIHRVTTEGTLDPRDEPFAGKYRDSSNSVSVVDSQGKEVYSPPQASEVQDMMQNLYDWANQDEYLDFLFLHPVLKASIIHFYTVYVHPFFDGNGRTARALMYYYLLKHDYGFMQFFSISKAIAAKRSAYYQAILNVEHFDSDLTYFLLFSTQMVLEAITTVEDEKNSEQSLSDWRLLAQESGASLNPRQEKLFKLHFRRGLLPVTIKKYQKINQVVYETARTDLLSLCDQGLLKMEKKGREFVFSMPEAQPLNARAPTESTDSSRSRDPSGR